MQLPCSSVETLRRMFATARRVYAQITIPGVPDTRCLCPPLDRVPAWPLVISACVTAFWQVVLPVPAAPIRTQSFPAAASCTNSSCLAFSVSEEGFRIVKLFR